LIRVDTRPLLRDADVRGSRRLVSPCCSLAGVAVGSNQIELLDAACAPPWLGRFTCRPALTKGKPVHFVLFFPIIVFFSHSALTL
jgi:hypothetical protein